MRRGRSTRHRPTSRCSRSPRRTITRATRVSASCARRPAHPIGSTSRSRRCSWPARSRSIPSCSKYDPNERRARSRPDPRRHDVGHVRRFVLAVDAEVLVALREHRPARRARCARRGPSRSRSRCSRAPPRRSSTTSRSVPCPIAWSSGERASRIILAGTIAFGTAFIPYLIPPKTVWAARQLQHLRATVSAQSSYVSYTFHF